MKVHRSTNGRRLSQRGGKPVFSSRPGSRLILNSLPDPKEGQERCPACRNVSTVTTRGYLRRHKDLFGNDCWNVARPVGAA